MALTRATPLFPPVGSPARRLHGTERRSPARVPGLGGGQLELRIEVERAAEFLAALGLAARNAVDEGEMLARLDLLGERDAGLERGGEAFLRLGVFAGVILAQAGGKRLLALALHDGAGREQRRASDDRQDVFHGLI